MAVKNAAMPNTAISKMAHIIRIIFVFIKSFKSILSVQIANLPISPDTHTVVEYKKYNMSQILVGFSRPNEVVPIV